MKNLFTLLFFSLFIVFSANAQKVKKIKNKLGYKQMETYGVITKGVYKGKRHGAYNCKRYNTSIIGNYRFGLKDGKWKYVTPSSQYTKIYHNGVSISSIHEDKFSKSHYTFISNTDSALLKIKHISGYTAIPKGDTTFISSDHFQGKKVNNKKHGVWKYSINGIKSETHYVLGKMVGTHTSYYPNGQIMCIRTTDSSGEYNGQHIIFYNDGDTAVTKEYSRGKKTGTWTSYYQSGKINKKASYIENRIDSYREYSEEGKLLNQLNQGSGTISSSEKKGYSSSSSYQNGLKHGNSITYRADTLYSSRTYKNGIWTNPKTKVEREYAKDTAYFNFTYAYLDSNWQQKATFDKGEAGLQRHLAFNTVFPSEALENDMQGTVHSLFVVGKEGQVTDQKTEGTKHGFGLEEEAIRVVKSTEYFWRPATQVGFPVHMRFRIPIKFQIF